MKKYVQKSFLVRLKGIAKLMLVFFIFYAIWSLVAGRLAASPITNMVTLFMAISMAYSYRLGSKSYFCVDAPEKKNGILQKVKEKTKEMMENNGDNFTLEDSLKAQRPENTHATLTLEEPKSNNFYG